MEKEFKDYLTDQNLSKNTITSYLYAIRQYESRYPKLSKQNLRDYKVYLIEHYKPQTVNLRIRAINCYLESIKKDQWKLTSVKVQQKPFLENVISEADYLYFTFRHRFAKSFLERYNDIVTLADLMGHSSIETTRIYLRKTSTEQQNIINEIID